MGNNNAFDTLWNNFEHVPNSAKTRPLWFWNNKLMDTTKESIREIMVNSKVQSGYFGFAILPNWIDNYLSDEYMDLYGYALDIAKELGMTMILYDENGWPSGQAGGLLNKLYPGDTFKRLDKIELDVIGPATGSIAIPNGEYRSYIGAVAMNMVTKEIIDITDNIPSKNLANNILLENLTDNELLNNDALEKKLIDSDDEVTYDVPEGIWKIMSFATVKDGYVCVDYFNANSVDKYIEVTFEAYYRRFPDYFGTVIDTAFFDEPGIYQAKGRTWTPKYNQMFEEKYGYNPITLYPAMWYDIGTDTEAARAALFGFRASLFSNYIKQVNDWCDAHGIKLTGHMDQEEPLNPTCITGDLMKSFQYEAIPGVDDIVNLNRSLKVYKLVSSTAYNYDKGLVMSESFGAMGEGVGITNMYKDTMGQFAKGVNFLIPHAIWHNNIEHIDNPPELSYRSEQYGPKLMDFNEFAGRLQIMLQNGRHVADIGLLYPIESLQGSFVFDVGNPYTGGIIPEEADYMNVGELLSTTIHRDFTYLHPEVFGDKCILDGSIIRLNNEINYENYKVIIMPGTTTISLKVLKKIKQFYDQGGKVIATTKLPSKSAEFGKDDEVLNIIEEMFGISKDKFYPRSTITYKASSVYNEYYAAKYAFDGDSSETSRWNAADHSGGDEWLEVDFGAITAVNKTVLKENPPYRVTSYYIQYWNGSNWVNCSAGSYIGKMVTNIFETINTSKIRLYIDSITDQSASIREFEVYDNNSNNLTLGHTVKYSNTNKNGGKAIFLGVNYWNELEKSLNECLDLYDVMIDNSNIKYLEDGSLSYIHKVKDEINIYYFANTSNDNISTNIMLRGSFTNLYMWDPHSGKRTKANTVIAGKDGEAMTQVPLNLSAVHSVFFVAENRK